MHHLKLIRSGRMATCRRLVLPEVPLHVKPGDVVQVAGTAEGLDEDSIAKSTFFFNADSWKTGS